MPFATTSRNRYYGITDPVQQYYTALASGNYPGSSGYWMDQPSNQQPNRLRSNLGYPGSRSRLGLASRYNVQPNPQDRLALNPAGAIDVESFVTPAPGDVASRFQPVDIIKSPGIASATQDLLANYTGRKTALPDFTAALDAATKSFLQDQKAYDTSGLGAILRDLNAKYATTSRDIGSRYTASDEAFANAARGLVGEARGTVSAIDQAAQDVANREQAAFQQQLSRYKLGTGTPTSATGAELRMLQRGIQDIQLPAQLAKTQRAYNLIGELALPVEQQIATRTATRLAQFESPMEREIYQNAYNTETKLKQLELSTAGMGLQQAVNYMKALAVPDELIQQVYARRIANLGGISQLEEASRYRGLQDVYGQPLSQAVNYAGTVGGYPVTTYNVPQLERPSRYGPAQERTGPTQGTPANAAPGRLGDYVDATGRKRNWIDEQRAYQQRYQVPQPEIGPGGQWYYPGYRDEFGYKSVPMTNPYAGTQSNSYYDPRLEAFVDRYTGDTTPGPQLTYGG